MEHTAGPASAPMVRTVQTELRCQGGRVLMSKQFSELLWSNDLARPRSVSWNAKAQIAECARQCSPTEPRSSWDGDSCESREILPSPGTTNSRVAQKSRALPGRYDFLWFFGTSLATNRSRPTDHGFNAAANLRCIRDFGRAFGSRTRQGNL